MFRPWNITVTGVGVKVSDFECMRASGRPVGEASETGGRGLTCCKGIGAVCLSLVSFVNLSGLGRGSLCFTAVEVEENKGVFILTIKFPSHDGRGFRGGRETVENR